VEGMFLFPGPASGFSARLRSFALAFALGRLLLPTALVMLEAGIAFLADRPIFVCRLTSSPFVEFFAGFYPGAGRMKLEERSRAVSGIASITLGGLAGRVPGCHRHADRLPACPAESRAAIMRS